MAKKKIANEESVSLSSLATMEKESIGFESGAKKLFLWFFLLLLIFSLYLLYQVLLPFFNSIIVSCIFAAICFPLYRESLRWFKGKRIPAALSVVLALAILVAIPILLFIISLLPQAVKSISSVNQWLSGQDIGSLISLHLDPLLQTLDNYFPELEISSMDIRGGLLAASKTTGQVMVSLGTHFLGNTVQIVLHFLLILMIMFYLLMNGVAIVKRVEYFFPLKPRQTAIIIDNLRRMARAVFLGGLLVAFLQGLFGGIGLSCVGINGMFWGTVMAFAALVPVLGTGLVWVPATIYLVLKGQTSGAIFLALWCGILVSGIDSFLRPYLMKDGAKVPILFLFLAILGGVQAFGMLGLLYGPMILGLVSVMLSIYNEEFHDILSHRNRKENIE